MTAIVLVTAPCALCGSLDAVPELTGFDREGDLDGEFVVRQCGQCGHAYLDPRPADGQLELLYSNSYAPFVARRRQTPRIVRKLLDFRDFGRAPRPTDARVLELGCGSGRNLKRLVAAGCSVTGIEPNRSAAAAAAEFGTVLVGDDRAVDDFDADTFDVVQAYMVIEHVGDPVDVLGKLRRVCRPGGAIELMVPNFSSRQRRRFGKDWYPLQVPRHLQHFTPATITEALERAGWAQIEVWQQPTTVDLWKSLALRSERSRFERALLPLKRLAPIIDLAGLPLLVLVTRVRGSSRMTVRAVNPM
jgi:SAM-dependent methyltransferase